MIAVLSLTWTNKAAVLLLSALFLLGWSLPAEASTSNDVSTVIDNVPLAIAAGDQAAFIKDGRTYVPLRVVTENLGSSVEWKPETRQIIITAAGRSPVPAPARTGYGQRDIQVVVDGSVKDFPADYGQPFITGLGRTVVPFRAIGEALGYGVSWDAQTRMVSIVKPPAPPPSRGLMPEPGRPVDGGAVNPPGTSSLLNELASYQTNLRLLDMTFMNSADLRNKDEADFSSAQLDQFRKYLTELGKYDASIRLPNGTVVASADLTIRGQSSATAEQLRAWIASEAPRIRGKMERELNREFIPIPDLAELYLRIGAEYGIRGDLAFAQAAKETHFWQFTGLVQPDQNNYCGLWATGSPLTGQESLNGADPLRVLLKAGRHGAIFSSPEAGVEAHIQHLYAYSCRDPLPPGKVLLSPRFNLVQRGCAPTWQGLNGRWAVPGTTYGQSIIQDYWLRAVSG